MTEQEIKEYIIRNFPRENESCEWKEYKNLHNTLCGHEGDDVVSYVSALANMNGGTLVIGVQDQTLNIIGIQDFGSYTTESAKARVIEKCRNLPTEDFSITELKAEDTGKVIWIMHIPKHATRLPVYAHNQAWQRTGDALVEIKEDRRNSILSELQITEDWSAEVIPDATLEDLDPEAIEKARKEFAKRNPTRRDEMQAWDDAKFLDKAKLTKRGKITRSALVLLGREESESLLGPYVAKIRWSLKTVDNGNKDYEIFGMPLLLKVDELYNKIRNTKYRYLKEGTLFPEEMLRYEPFNIREPLNNCIAHQDYTCCARIEVVEYEDDHLVFRNHGSFLPNSVEDVVIRDCPESVYRNKFLVEAMRNLNMIETEGGGIKKIYQNQRERFFPLPEYDLTGNMVKVEIMGKVLDMDFARLLAADPSLTLEQIMMLDSVQKHKPISEECAKYLRKHKYIEGRKPNYYLAHQVVAASKDRNLKSQYVKNKSFDDAYFMSLIVDYIRKFKKASRTDIEVLLHDKLSDVLEEKQKANKVGNLLTKLRKQGKIVSGEGKQWILPKIK